MFFLSDLMRHLDIPVEVDFMAVASYGSATKSSGVVRILKDLDAAIEGRDVLIVEDIVDSGLTLQYLLRNLAGRNPRSLEVCALLIKPERRKVDLETRYVGLRDPRPVRDRLRARPRRALPQPALRGGVEAVRAACSALAARGRRRNAGATLADPRSPSSSTRGAPGQRREFIYEQVLQERRLSDSDRRRPGVLRPEADRKLEPRAALHVRQPAHPARPRPGQEPVARPEGQQRRRHAAPTAPSTRSATRTPTRRR